MQSEVSPRPLLVTRACRRGECECPALLTPSALSPQQIRKLRRELESSQEKVATLTSQLSANVSPCGSCCRTRCSVSPPCAGLVLPVPTRAWISPLQLPASHTRPWALARGPGVGAHPFFLHLSQANLVAAFEQSLVSMTSRLRHLAETAEEKVGAVGIPWGHWGHWPCGRVLWGWGMLHGVNLALPAPRVLSGRALCHRDTLYGSCSAPPGHRAAGPARDH